MEISAAVAALGALAQESRLAVFRTLVEAGAAGLAVGEIGERHGLPGATLSFHLAQLRAAGLVRCTREGRSIRCAADYPAMDALVAYLLQNCCRDEASCAVPRCTPAPAARKARAASSVRSKGARREASSRARRRR